MFTNFRPFIFFSLFFLSFYNFSFAHFQNSDKDMGGQFLTRIALLERCLADDLNHEQALGRDKWFLKLPESDTIFQYDETEFRQYGPNPEHRTQRDPFYPTFGIPTKIWKNNEHGVKIKSTIFAEGEDRWRAPTDANSTESIREGYRFAGICIPGCFAASQIVKFSQQIEQSVESIDSIQTLASNSTFERLSFQQTQIKKSDWIKDIFDANQEVLDFKTASGKTLSVTLDHPIVSSDGSLKRAKDFIQGVDFVMLDDGKLDLLVSIQGRSYFGKAYNLKIQSNEILNHIVSAGGILNGTLQLQHMKDVDLINQFLFRSELMEGIINL